MDWFWQVVESLHKSAAFAVLRDFKPIDWIFLFVTLWGLAQGSRKGFSDMFGKILGLFLTSMMVLSFYKQVAAVLHAHTLLPEAVAEPIAFFLLSVFLWFSVSWCINAFGKIFKVEAQGILKTLGGMILGGLHMMLFLSFLSQFILFLPIDALQDSFKTGKSYSGHTIVRIVPALYKRVVTPFFNPDAKKPLVSYKTGG